MADTPPSMLRRVAANGAFLAGLWFVANAIWDAVRAEHFGLEDVAGLLFTFGAGAMFLAVAWRLRDAMRWSPPDGD